MSTPRSDDRFLLGLLVGVGVGIAIAVVARRRRKRLQGADSFDHARSEVDRDASPGGDRRAERAGRDLMRRVDGIRSAGM